MRRNSSWWFFDIDWLQLRSMSITVNDHGILKIEDWRYVEWIPSSCDRWLMVCGKSADSCCVSSGIPRSFSQHPNRHFLTFHEAVLSRNNSKLMRVELVSSVECQVLWNLILMVYMSCRILVLMRNECLILLWKLEARGGRVPGLKSIIMVHNTYSDRISSSYLLLRSL